MWTVLRSFESEPEARVVEAYLKAHHIDVQLLGTHTHAAAVAPGSLKTASLRMMVRQDQKAEAARLLVEAESRAHLSVVTESPAPGASPPKSKYKFNRAVVTLILIALALLSYLIRQI